MILWLETNKENNLRKNSHCQQTQRSSGGSACVEVGW